MISFEEMEEGKVYTSKLSNDNKVYKRHGANLFFRYKVKSTARKMWSFSYASRTQKNYSPKVNKDRGFMGLTGIGPV